jgi:hypothetical protein
MSDLLSRLGQRALGTQPRVQPLLRPGREVSPVQDAGITAMEDFSQQSDQARIQRADETSQSSQPFTASWPSPPEPAPSQKLTRPTNEPPPRHRPFSLREVIENIFPQPEVGPQHSAAPAEPFVQQDLSIPEIEPIRGATPQPVSPTVPTPRQPQRAIHSSPQLASTLRATRTSERSAEVQVSIGRIELHAPPPPPPQTMAAPSKATTLSLESYLAQRRGGRA